MNLIRHTLSGNVAVVESLDGYALDEWEVLSENEADPNASHLQWTDGGYKDIVIYQEQRAVEYPPMADFADALYWKDKGVNGPWDAYVAACDAVKAKYPKQGS
ncbi:hypothetical protein UFOVP36_2 [uncultured Caudovirales phage]|uniref:Uncharacterized protein n=1 Tax=uncultured Caudovirales phage TaxID=2100421 RepID=A0A6J5KJG8_9CAUD|nr:hypothetical protein UFOVP36_2 [uncultured Caudovirales phage]